MSMYNLINFFVLLGIMTKQSFSELSQTSLFKEGILRTLDMVE